MGERKIYRIPDTDIYIDDEGQGVNEYGERVRDDYYDSWEWDMVDEVVADIMREKKDSVRNRPSRRGGSHGRHGGRVKNKSTMGVIGGRKPKTPVENTEETPRSRGRAAGRSTTPIKDKYTHFKGEVMPFETAKVKLNSIEDVSQYLHLKPVVKDTMFTIKVQQLRYIPTPNGDVTDSYKLSVANMLLEPLDYVLADYNSGMASLKELAALNMDAAKVYMKIESQVGSIKLDEENIFERTSSGALIKTDLENDLLKSYNSALDKELKSNVGLPVDGLVKSYRQKDIKWIMCDDVTYSIDGIIKVI